MKPSAKNTIVKVHQKKQSRCQLNASPARKLSAFVATPQAKNTNQEGMKNLACDIYKLAFSISALVFMNFQYRAIFSFVSGSCFLCVVMCQCSIKDK